MLTYTQGIYYGKKGHKKKKNGKMQSKSLDLFVEHTHLGIGRVFRMFGIYLFSPINAHIRENFIHCNYKVLTLL